MFSIGGNSFYKFCFYYRRRALYCTHCLKSLIYDLPCHFQVLFNSQNAFKPIYVYILYTFMQILCCLFNYHALHPLSNKASRHVHVTCTMSAQSTSVGFLSMYIYVVCVCHFNGKILCMLFTYIYIHTYAFTTIIEFSICLDRTFLLSPHFQRYKFRFLLPFYLCFVVLVFL